MTSHPVEAVEPLAQGRQVDAVRVRLRLVPPRSETELEPAVGDPVDSGCHVREHRRMTVGHAGDHAADADAAGCLRERGQRRPPLQARAAAGLGEDRFEVVEVPGGLEQLDAVRRLPHLEHR